MTLLSPTFMFIFLPIALGILAVTPKKLRRGILAAEGVMFFVCINIHDLFSLSYVVLILAAVMSAVLLHEKTGKILYLNSCAFACLVAAAVILTLRAVGGAGGKFLGGLVLVLMSSVSLCVDRAAGRGLIPGDMLDVASCVVYFPTMLVGPFVGYEELSERLEGADMSRRFSSGILLFLKGFVKAFAVGAVLHDAYAGIMEAGDGLMGMGILIILAIMYFLSFYSFLSGLSDIASGISSMLGAELESDMGNPFTNHTPSGFIRGFFRGFSVFARLYIVRPLLSILGESLPVRLFTSALSAAFILLIFCKNAETLIVLLVPLTAAEYFVLFGRRQKTLVNPIGRIIASVLTFAVVVASVWIIELGGIGPMISILTGSLRHGFLDLPYGSAEQLLDPMNAVLPAAGIILSILGGRALGYGSRERGEGRGGMIFKWVVSIALLGAFCAIIIFILPRHPELATGLPITNLM